MQSKYAFDRLIQRYSHGKLVIEQKPKRNPDGSIDASTVTQELNKGSFAVVPLSLDQLSFGGGGVYKNSDRKLYCYTQIPSGAYVNHTTKATERFRVMEDSDYSDFDSSAGDGLYIYVLRRSDTVD